MNEHARKILRMQGPERSFVMALLLSAYTDTEGNFLQSPRKLLADIFYPGRRDVDNQVARLTTLMREAGYLENRNVGGNRGEWVLHLPVGTQSLAGQKMAVQMQLLSEVTDLVQRWGHGRIPTIMNILEAMQQKPK